MEILSKTTVRIISSNSIVFADNETNLSIIYYYFARGYNNNHQMKMNQFFMAQLH